ncbi:uncharacterized protein LOC129185496 isoform X2 [Dunckerocampus dactyliophorus]|uniref:uncharacterized protein LOC129185496 isoform X2 n=1 Tax=Dunckerocampus dactyliophorus TaxID=161453 RepID=UPI00240560E4|nr:uncharacterized protein LOC129185496 isoform X2 [Dunckerocampus dactyliophorus]
MRWLSKAKRSTRRLDHFDGLIPFDFKTTLEDSTSKYLVNILSLELTYFSSSLLFAVVVKRRVWDYAVTVTILHVFITSIGEYKKTTSIPDMHALDISLGVCTFNKSVFILFTVCCSDAGVSTGMAVVAGLR